MLHSNCVTNSKKDKLEKIKVKECYWQSLGIVGVGCKGKRSVEDA